MKKCVLCCLILLHCFVLIRLAAQNRAPSVYLDYNDYDDGDIIVNTLRVASLSPLYTYYNAMCFGGGVDGGGYCGMQNAPEGHNFIFSLWNPTSVQEAIRAEYIGSGTVIDNFGGEGTGLKSVNLSVGWQPNQWYTLVTRVWSLNSHSHYGFWVLNETDNTWYHLVTMDYPVDNLKFKSRTSAFIEDWLGNGSQVREIHRKNGWKRKLNMQWFSFNQATISRVYPDAGCANYINNYDGGIIANGYYFIKSGGVSTSPVTNVSGTTVYLPNSNVKPNFQIGEISNLTTNNYGDSLELKWDVNSSKSPQFSFNIEVYNNASMTGLPIASFSEIKPHARKATIKLNNLSVQTCFCKLFIYDIFNNRSNELTDKITGILNVILETELIISPNPTNDRFSIKSDHSILKVEVFSTDGQLMQIKKANDIKTVDISKLAKGLYLVRLFGDFGVVAKVMIKK